MHQYCISLHNVNLSLQIFYSDIPKLFKEAVSQLHPLFLLDIAEEDKLQRCARVFRSTDRKFVERYEQELIPKSHTVLHRIFTSSSLAWTESKSNPFFSSI